MHSELSGQSAADPFECQLNSEIASWEAFVGIERNVIEERSSKFQALADDPRSLREERPVAALTVARRAETSVWHPCLSRRDSALAPLPYKRDPLWSSPRSSSRSIYELRTIRVQLRVKIVNNRRQMARKLTVSFLFHFLFLLASPDTHSSLCFIPFLLSTVRQRSNRDRLASTKLNRVSLQLSS